MLIRGPRHKDRTEQALDTLLLVLVGWTVIYLLIVVPVALHKAAVASLLTLLLVTYVTALGLLRRGWFKAASWVYLLGNWLVRTVAIVLSGGTDAVAIVFYLVLPVSAAWLLDTRAVLLSAGACVGSLIALASLEQLGVGLPMYLEAGGPIITAIGLLQAVLVITVPVAHMLQVLQEALLRSRTAEQALERCRAGLEGVVRQRTAELEDARDQALAANGAKSAFLSKVGHELRSPLNTILLLSDPEWIDPATPDGGRRDLHLIRRSGEDLLRLIDDLLDGAQIDARQIALEYGTFDLFEMLHELIEQMERRAAEKALDFTIEQPPGLPRFVAADAGKLRRVLLDLMDHAIESADRGRITLRMGARPEDSTGRLLLNFEIADTGSSAGREQLRGGAGLSVARRYMLAMGGSLRFETVPGEGDRFLVNVPVDSCADGGSGPRRVTGLAGGQPEYRILIVDDRPEDRLVLRRILQGAGFQVQAAATAEAGIQIFRSWRPHFIWMDRRLPLMDGLQATSSIRSLEGGWDVKIAGLSASALPAEREEMVAAGLNDFVRKPFHPDQIFECLARHLGVEYEYGATRCQSA
jgi:signal transduction histidine kinase/ActR/RegA family two-component response regulator